MEEETVHVHFMCPAELRTRLKVEAAQQGTTMTALIIEALEGYVEREEER